MRLNEGIDIKIVYCDDTPSEYIDDVTMNDIYDILDSSLNICKIVDVSGNKKKVVWTDEYGFERAYELKKSAKKSLKESKIDYVFEDLANEYTDEYCNSHGGNFTKESIRQAFLDGCNDKKAPKGYHEFVAWQAGQRQIGKKSLKESKDIDFFNAMVKKFNFTKDEIKRYKDKTYISVLGILFDRIRSVPTYSDEWYNAMNDCWEGIQTAKENGFNVAYEERAYDKIMMTPNYNRESMKSARKLLKESSNKKVSDFENTNTKFIAIMDIEDFYDEDGNAGVLWEGKSSDLKKSDFYDFTVLETETYDKVLYLFVDIAEF